MFFLEYTAASNRGERPENQDNLFIADKIPLVDLSHKFSDSGCVCTDTVQVFCVCDGVGGGDGGKAAAAMTAAGIREAMSLIDFAGASLSDIVLKLAWYVQNDVVNYFIGKGARGGTTLTMVAVRNAEYGLLNIGDSPAFLYDASTQTLTELTQRHNLYFEKLRQGIPPEDADGCRLLSYVGKYAYNPRTMAMAAFPASALSYITEGTLKENDTLLLCSDGITNAFANDALAKQLRDNSGAEALSDAAAVVPEADNCTAICLTLRSEPNGKQALRKEPQSQK